MSRLQFMSPDWLAMTKELFVSEINAAGGMPDLNLSLIERFLEVPDDAPGPASGEPALVITITGGVIEIGYGAGPSDRAGVEIECYWSDAWKSSSLKYGPELDSFNAERKANGRYKVIAASDGSPAFLKHIHDLVADRTIPPGFHD